MDKEPQIWRGNSPTSSRADCGRGLALVLTVLLVAMLTAAAAQLAMLSATESVSTSRLNRTLQHELAVDSVIAWLTAAAKEAESSLDAQLDRRGEAIQSFEIGTCTARVAIADDGAKFNPTVFSDIDQQKLLERKLQALARTERLPEVALNLRPIPASGIRPRLRGQPVRPARRYLWFDQLFAPEDPHEVFCWSTQDIGSPSRDPVWSDRVSFFGDGRVDVRRATAAVLEAMLGDLSTQLVQDILSARSASRDPNVVQRALAGLGQGVRAQASGRLVYGLNRFSLTIHTAIGNDVRRWYVVLTCKDGQTKVHHRSPITW